MRRNRTRTLGVVVATLASATAGAVAAAPAPRPTVTAAATSENASPSSATDAVSALSVPSPSRAEPRHVVYLEAFGKGGLWGLGYAFTLDRRLAVGAVASSHPLDGQRVTSLAPYVALYPLATRRHRWFIDAGPQLVRLSTPSPVPEWSGTVEHGIGGQLSTGYEYRRGVLLRAFAMVGAGKGGVAPWFGVDVGWTL